MQKRRLLATATLTALLLSVGTLQTAPIGASAELAPHAQAAAPAVLQSADGAATPQWGAAYGFRQTAAFAWGAFSAVLCAGFAGPGAIACGIAGAA